MHVWIIYFCNDNRLIFCENLDDNFILGKGHPRKVEVSLSIKNFHTKNIFSLFHPADPRGITKGGLPGIPIQHLPQVVPRVVQTTSSVHPSLHFALSYLLNGIFYWIFITIVWLVKNCCECPLLSEPLLKTTAHCPVGYSQDFQGICPPNDIKVFRTVQSLWYIDSSLQPHISPSYTIPSGDEVDDDMSQLPFCCQWEPVEEYFLPTIISYCRAVFYPVFKCFSTLQT